MADARNITTSVGLPCHLVTGDVRQAAKSGKPEEEVATLMAAETWFDAALV